MCVAVGLQNMNANIDKYVDEEVDADVQTDEDVQEEGNVHVPPDNDKDSDIKRCIETYRDYH